MSMKDRKARANEQKRCQEAYSAFLKRNPNYCNDANQTAQHAKLLARLTEVSQLAAGCYSWLSIIFSKIISKYPLHLYDIIYQFL